MDSSRLLEVVTDYVAEVAANSIQANLTALVNALQASVSASNANTDQQFRSALTVLNDALEKCPSNNWPPTKQIVLAKTGLANTTGRGLRQRVHMVIATDSILKSTALAELQSISADFQKKITEATQTATNLRALGVALNLPPTDEAEVAVVLPDSIDASSLILVQRELKIVDQLLGVLAEITGTTVGSARVQEISKGSLIVVVLANLPTAVLLIKLVDGVISIWQRIIDLKIKHKELEKLSVPQSTLDDLQKHIDAKLNQGVQELAVQLMAQNMITDEGRRNEATNQLRFSAKQLAARIDAGATVEVSVAPTQGSESESNPEKAAQRLEIATRGALMRDTPQLEKPMLAIGLDAKESEDKRSGE